MSYLAGVRFDSAVDLDREAGRASGLQHITSSLPIFETHFPRFPVLPGVLLLGGLAELGAELLHELSGGSWRLVDAERIRFRHYVQPGDTVAYEVAIAQRSETYAEVSGMVRVEQRTVASVRILRFRPASP